MPNRLLTVRVLIVRGSTVELLMCFNFPPWLRTQPGFMVLIGIIPGPKCANPQAYLQHVADQFDCLLDGITVYDAHEQRSVTLLHCASCLTNIYVYFLCTGSDALKAVSGGK